MKNKIVSVLLAGLFLLVSQTSIVEAAGVVGDGSPGSCTEAALDAALVGGGLVTFNCGAAPVSILLTAQKLITANTTIDGGGLITLDGGNMVRHFEVQAGFTLTLENLTLSGGNVGGANNGGSVLVNAGASVFTTNVDFTDNLASNDGGAIASGGTLNLLNTTFSNNQSDGVGGAIYTLNGTVVIDNATFTGNHAPGPGDDGGAMVQDGGTVTIAGSLFDGNYVEDKGGAIDVYSGTLNVTDTTFQNHNNPLITEGGAIYVNTGNITLSGVVFNNNQTFEADGGAIYFNTTGQLIIQNSASRSSSFTGNTAHRDGGAIFIENGGGAIVSISDTSFTSNTSNGNNTITPLGGGAIYNNSNAPMTITGSTFSGNTAAGDGGAIWMGNANGSLFITGSTFDNNSASDDGGAIFNNTNHWTDSLNITTSVFTDNIANGDDGEARGGAIYNTPDGITVSNEITLTTFTGNQARTSTGAARGGAIYHAGNALTIANVTFSGNNANKTTPGIDDPQGGALFITGGITIYNTTFGDNSVTETSGTVAGGGSIFNAGVANLSNTIVFSGFPDNCLGTIIDGGNNIDFDGGNTCGAGFSNSDPELQTLTGSPAYYPISATSAALDAGNNAICANAYVNNQSQNGLTRPIDGNGDSTATCDIGSFERPEDNISPSVTINQAAAQADPTSSSPVNFTVVFSEVVTGFTDADVTLGGTAGATTAVVTGSGTTYNVAVSGMTTTGTVIASIPADAAVDGANNGNTASTSTDNIVTFEVDGPMVTIDQAATQADPTDVSPINFTVVFSDAVTGFTDADVVLGGTAGATTAVVTGSGTTYNVAVSGMTTSGTVTASIPADAAVDGFGNGNMDSTSTDNTVTFQVEGPSVTVEQAATQADPTDISPINFTVVFSDAVTGFTDADVVLGGTAGATTAVVTGSGTTYNVAVSGMAGGGTVIVSVPAGVAVDGFGNGNTASTSTDNTVTFEKEGPTVTVNQAASQDDPTSESPINFTVVFSAAVSGFTDADVTLGGTAGATDALVTGSGTTYNVAVSGMTTSGAVTVSILAGVAVDGDGNGNSASTSTDNTVTYSEPEEPAEEETPTTPVTLPDTGFAPGVVSSLPAQPAEKAYAATDMVLEIPSLNVEMTIIGVPEVDGIWDVTWLGSNAGYLYGSAFPTWEGNTIITGHVWDAFNRPGPFAEVKSLQYGDQIIIHAWGQTFTYEVRESDLAFPSQVKNVFQHEEYDWVTLVTCETFSSSTDAYLHRRVVRAVLVGVD